MRLNKAMKKYMFLILVFSLLLTQLNVVNADATSDTYLIFDVYGHYDDNGAVINEIEVYDSTNSKVTYSVSDTDVYDSVRKGLPHYWNGGIWDLTNLNDGTTSYSTTDSTVVNYASTPESSEWTRFVLKISNVNRVSKIKVWTGRISIPKEISVYQTSSYSYENNIKNRSNDGLLLFGKISLPSTASTSFSTEITNGIISEPSNLSAALDGSQVVLRWEAVSGVTKYYIYKSETSGGNYTKIQTASDIIGTTFTDTDLNDGKTYYYVVTAANDTGESPYSNEVSARINTTEEIITVDTLKTEVNLGSEFTTDITLHNAVNMCAEDFKVSYNPELFDYVGYEEVSGLKVYKEIKSATPGTIRFIVASLGKANAINGDKVMVKLKFKAKKAGKDKIDVIKGRIANNSTIEKDILDANCGEKEITVKPALDVNRTGEFTLLDLGIDAWYYGDPAASTDTSKYDTDVVINSQVDNDDLLAIVAEVMNNTNYTPNN